MSQSHGDRQHIMSPEKCVIYWDYENCPIPHDATVQDIKSFLEAKIYTLRSKRMQIEIKCYIPLHYRHLHLYNQIKRDMDLNGIKVYEVPTEKAEAVDKRILVDMALDIYEWKNHYCNSIILISGDRDYAHLLSRVRNAPEIAMSCVIIFDENQTVNENLLQSVDHVIHGISMNHEQSETKAAESESTCSPQLTPVFKTADKPKQNVSNESAEFKCHLYVTDEEVSVYQKAADQDEIRLLMNLGNGQIFVYFIYLLKCSQKFLSLVTDEDQVRLLINISNAKANIISKYPDSVKISQANGNVFYVDFNGNARGAHLFCWCFDE